MSESDYEPAENSFAKNIAYDAIEAELEDQGFAVIDEFDLIDLADAVVEALLRAGVTIPETIHNPHGN
jgi:hypothetical protein